MAKRFIRWILPLLVVLTIAMAFAVGAVTHAGATSAKQSQTIATPTTTSSGKITPDAMYRP